MTHYFLAPARHRNSRRSHFSLVQSFRLAVLAKRLARGNAITALLWDGIRDARARQCLSVRF